MYTHQFMGQHIYIQDVLKKGLENNGMFGETLPTICLGIWCLLNKIEEKEKKK